MKSENISVLRYRGPRSIKVENLDIFPKIQENYKQTSSVGGTFSVVTFLLILWLVLWETIYYLDSRFVLSFTPDIDFKAKLKVNIDITVAMPCSSIGADILDSTDQNAFKFGSLSEDNTWFELSPIQQSYFDNKRHFNSYLRDEYHAIQDLLWRRNFITTYDEMPSRSEKPNRSYDACRLHGSLILNKVAGNFHITAGKSFNFPQGHIHLNTFMSSEMYNFSHRINRFSFGEPSPGIVHPLEGDEYISSDTMSLVNYFVEVVPTDVETFMTSVQTYQYSVKTLYRSIDHSKGSHGIPGIYFKYDTSALKVKVNQERDNFYLFITRLCSLVGGIYICTGFLNNFTRFIWNYFVKTDGNRKNLKT